MNLSKLKALSEDDFGSLVTAMLQGRMWGDSPEFAQSDTEKRLVAISGAILEEHRRRTVAKIRHDFPGLFDEVEERQNDRN